MAICEVEDSCVRDVQGGRYSDRAGLCESCTFKIQGRAVVASWRRGVVAVLVTGTLAPQFSDNLSDSPFPGTAMTVELRTNVDNPSLSLSEFRGVGSHIHAAELAVRSGSYHASLRFLFDDALFIKFVEDLRRMDSDLRGRARLREAEMQEPYIAFELTDAGAVEVSGVLFDWEHGAQRMEFHFTTDKAVLAPFAADLEIARQHQVMTQSDED